MKSCKLCKITEDLISFPEHKRLCRPCYNEMKRKMVKKAYRKNHEHARCVKNKYREKNRSKINRKNREAYRRKKELSPLSYRRF
jgi:hypothetical protein